jgi:nucleotide-binding universal stress UspA family protein
VVVPEHWKPSEQSDAQLLVVGTHHHTRPASVLLGSVTPGVLHHTVCPPAVVPTAILR